MNQYENQVPPPGAIPMMVVQNPDGTSYLVPVDPNTLNNQPQPVYVQQPGGVPEGQYPAPQQQQYQQPVQQYQAPIQYQQGGYVQPSGPVPSAGYQHPTVVPQTVIPVQQEGPVEIDGGEQGGKGNGLTGKFGKLDPARGFIKKVYALVFLQLAITTVICSLFFIQVIKDWVYDHVWVTYAAYIIAFAILCVLVCCRKQATTYPTNLILLCAFTFFFSIAIGLVISFYDVSAVAMAIGATAIIVLGLSLAAWFLPCDMTGCGMLMFALCLALICFGFLNLFFRSKFLYTVYASCGAIIFSLYIVYDTQVLMIGSKKYTYGPDDYIIGALNLYLDIINLFLYLLQLIGMAKD